MRGLALILLAALLSGCSNHLDDLQKFVSDADRTMRGNVDPVPPIRPYVPYLYTAANLPDPFASRLVPARAHPAGHHPAQPLEKFALSELQMVGSLTRGGMTYALIKAPDKDIYYVKRGDYMGLDSGRVTQVSSDTVVLQETLLDSNGAWAQRRAQIHLKE